jgi:hypothetical protein
MHPQYAKERSLVVDIIFVSNTFPASCLLSHDLVTYLHSNNKSTKFQKFEL